MTKLYGRSAMLEHLVPHLVGLEYRRDRNRPLKGKRYVRNPIVQVNGGRATGKTAVLRALSDAYSGRIPVAYVDLTAPGFAVPGLAGLDQTVTPNASEVTDLLYVLSHQLGLNVPEFGRPLNFPRLVHGLLAITVWWPDDQGEGIRPAELATAQTRLDELLKAIQPDRTRRRTQVRELTTAVSGYIGTLAGLPPGTEPVVKAIIDVITAELFAPRVNREAMQWWAQRNVGPAGDGPQRLSALARHFRDGDDNRMTAERHLTTALLADVAGYYGWFRRHDRDTRPLILLDNTDTDLGGKVLGLVSQALEEAALDNLRNPLAIVAGAMGEGTAHPSVETIAGVSGWHEPDPPAAAGWTHRLGLYPLDRESIEEILGKDAPHGVLARLIHRLSDGRAGIARTLAEAAVQRQEATGAAGPEHLLDPPAPDEPPVTARLLERLIPDDMVRRRLVFYSPALDDGAAVRLSDTFPPQDRGGVPVEEVREHLRKGSWPLSVWPGMDGPFVGNRTLRTLLLHELITSYDDAWTNIHRRLRSLYDPHDLGPGAPEHHICYLHHSMALGDSDSVVRSLHHRYVDHDPGSWLADLKVVCAAPHPPAGIPRQRPTTDPCPACQQPGDRVHQAIATLIHDLWEQSAPLAVPDREKIDNVEFQLRVLAQERVATDQRIYYRAMRKWPEQLRSWAQAPDLPIPGEHDA
jgi:hypothetical protein